MQRSTVPALLRRQHGKVTSERREMVVLMRVVVWVVLQELMRVMV